MNPRALADRWLRADLARAFSGLVLAMVACLALGLFATARRNGTAFGTNLGADYAEFYAVGLLLDRAEGGRLYDLGLQDDLLHQTLPAMPRDEHLPFAYPPFLAPAFRPLARLPFAGSFAAWLAITLAAYAASVALLLGRDAMPSGEDRATAWLLALSFEPFAMECWLGGQLSALGTLAIAATLALRKRGRPFLCGLALSGLLYKPTLALVLVPLLLVGRRWKVLAGFALGAVALGLACLAVAGPSGCLDFANLLAGYGTGGGSVAGGFKTMKYVDLRAFLRLLGVATPWAIPLGLPAAAGLVMAWSRAGAGAGPDPDRGRGPDLAWSAALCWTPVLNLYGPIYDACLVVPGLLLAARALRDPDEACWPPAFRGLLALLYLSALFAPALAGGLGLQPLTPALAAMGTYLLVESLRAPEGGARVG